jgi:hypothetical protein
VRNQDTCVKEKRIVAYRPVARKRPRSKQLEQPLLGSGPSAKWNYCWKRCFPCGPLRGYMTRPTEFSSVSECSAVEWRGTSWLVSEWIRGLLRSSPCEPLLLEAGSWGTGIVREPRVRGTSAVECRYQITTGEDTADRKDLVRVVVKCWVCELAIVL